MKYLNQLVFHLYTFEKAGWILFKVYASFDEAKLSAKRFKGVKNCRIDEVSYRNVYLQMLDNDE